MKKLRNDPGNVKKNPLRHILFSFKKVFFFVGLFSFIINMLMLVPALYMLQIYDRVLVSRNMETLIALTILMLGMYMLLAFLEWVRSRVVVRAGNKMDEQLSSKTFGAAFSNALKVGAGNAQQAFSDLTQVRQFLTGRGLFAFFDVPWAPIYIFVAFLLHPGIGMLAIGSSIILIILTLITEVASKNPLREANRLHNKASTFAGINFRNSEAIEAMGMLKNVKNSWFPMQLSMLSQQTKASDRAATISSITKFVRLSAQSLTFGVGSYFVIQQEMSAGQMIAGSILTGRALAPIDMLMGSWRQFTTARNAYKRLSNLFMNYEEKKAGTKLPAPKGNIELKKVVAVPPNSNIQILKGISFSAKAGDMIAVLGPSAAGKSTLARVIVGVWPPLVGEVRLDGADLKQWAREELGQYIGYLPQTVELLDGTIAQNIARFGRLDSEKIVEAAKLANVHEMILGFKDGYDTYIGEGGVILSGGQRQRIGLARAVYGNPVLIVLDEPNSNLDDAGEQGLVDALKKLKQKNSTVFIITHRKSILSVVDKAMVLSNGTLQLYGKKEEVFKKLAQASNM